MRLFTAELQARGVHRIGLNVRADNPSAFVFWQSTGFELSLYQFAAILVRVQPLRETDWASPRSQAGFKLGTYSNVIHAMMASSTIRSSPFRIVCGLRAMPSSSSFQTAILGFISHSAS